MTVYRFIIALCLCFLLNRPALATGDLKIVASFFPVYAVARNVAGNSAEVLLLVSSSNPHGYQLVPEDLRKLEAAKVIVLNGLNIDNWVADAVKKLNNSSSKKIVVLSRGLDEELIKYEQFNKSTTQKSSNPHIWLDPVIMTHCASNLMQELILLDPDNANNYISNTVAFCQKLTLLHQQIKQELASIKNRKVLVWHDAFAYFARRYDIQVAGIIEETPETSPTPRKLARIYDIVRAQKPALILSEPGAPTRVVRQIAQDLNLPILIFDTLETGKPEYDYYEKKMRENAQNLRKYLN